MLGNIILGISGLIILLLSVVIIVSNPKRSVNRTLSAFLFTGFVWLLANLFANFSDSLRWSLYFTRATAVGAILLPFTFLLFCQAYTASKKTTPKAVFPLAILPLFLLFLVPTDLNISSVGPNGTDASTGLLYKLLVPTIAIYFYLGFHYLVKFFKRANSIQKTQLRYMFLGLLLTILPALVTNGFLPALGYSNAAAYGPGTVVFVSLFTSIAIIRHQLLDIRLLVARALAYALLIVSLTFTFGVLVFFVARKLLPTSASFVSEEVIPLMTALILAFSYQPAKRFFDKLTNSLFYRDAYDAQSLLDKLNRVLVTNIELKNLLEKSCEVLEEHIKPTSVYIYVNDHGTYGKYSSKLTVDERDLFSQLEGDTTIVDILPENQERLRAQLLKRSIAVVSQLSIQGKQNIGYLVFGPKKSGNLFSKQDLNIIDIVANELVIAIQNALRFEEIEKFNVTLQEKVEEATRQLRRSNEKLKALDETKDEFISMASHQLRTPLTSVKGYVSMVLEGDAGKLNKQQSALLTQAYNSSQRMVYLIADLLNVSRLKTGKFVIDRQPTQLIDVIEGEIQQLQETAKARNLSLNFNKPQSFPLLSLDETKTRQVIMNFADNAIYYTPAGGKIEIDLIDKGTSIEFLVTDNGIGVPKAEQHHLFTKFYRANNAQKARPDGTGLGLFMAKKVIVAQGGAIIFRSREGKGSTFGFSFPKDKVTQPVDKKSA